MVNTSLGIPTIKWLKVKVLTYYKQQIIVLTQDIYMIVVMSYRADIAGI